MQQNIPSQEKIKTAQKTSNHLDNLYIDKANMDGALEASLEQFSCIWYPIIFWKKSVLALLDSKNEINIIHPILAKEPSFWVRPTNVKAWKIDGITLDTYKIVVVAFLVID